MTFTEINSVFQYFYELNIKTILSKSTFIQFFLRQTDSDCSPSTTMMDDNGSWVDLKGLFDEIPRSRIGVKLSRRKRIHRWFNIVLRHLCFDAALRILPDSGADDGHINHGTFYPHLSYGVALWGGCSTTTFARTFTLQNKAVRIIATLQWRESCRLACNLRSKFNLIRDEAKGTIPNWETQDAISWASDAPLRQEFILPTKLASLIKSAVMSKAFKLVWKPRWYSKNLTIPDEFLAHSWDPLFAWY